MFSAKNRHIDEWNRRESSEIDQHIHSQPIFDKEVRQYNKDSFQQMVLEKLDIHTFKKKKCLDTDFTPFTKINSKWFIDLNVKCKIIRVLENNTGKNPDDFESDDVFRNDT